MKKIRDFALVITIIMILVLIATLFCGCSQQKQGTQAADPAVTGNQQGFGIVGASGTTGSKGVSLSPKSFSQADFTDFFSKAKQAGGIVSWSGDWNELANAKSSGPAVTAGLAATYKYIPIIIPQFFTQSTGKLVRPLDDSAKKSYKDSAAAFAEKYKPEYMGFGIEINVLYEKSPADFDDFAVLYSEVYDAVKAASPGTKVFTVFQLERMKGMDGGLFGGKNDPSQNEWQLLDKFPKSDIIAFTTYPGLIYKSPSEIPSDYYTEIRQHTSKPIAFTEVGWQSAAEPAGWESSEAEQAEFVSDFFSLTKEKGLGQEFSIWSFLYDQNTAVPFSSMGLYTKDGQPKAAWEKWVTG